MIFFVDNNGKIINSQPETVYQGAADTNNIYLIAPFAANLSFAVAFRLPNGAYTERYLMTNGGQLEGVECPKTGNRYALWRLSIPNNITQYYGTVHAQFYAYATDSAITATSSTTFVVSQGVPEILPDTPTQDIYNQILTVLSQLQAQLNNGVFAARAIYWWIDTYVYGMNEITFYPLGEYGAFVRSIVTENEGNEPYDEEGNLNSEYWQELVDFNKIIQALEDAVKAAEEAAESAENAAESAEASAESAEEAKNFADSAAASAEDAAKSAEEAAQSASDAAASAEAAAESAYNAAVSEGNAAQSATEAAEAAQTVTDYLGKTTEFVDELPETGDEDKLYFVAGESNNLYSIYIWKNGEWVKLGETNLVLNNTNIYISVLIVSGWVSKTQTLTLTGLTADDGVCVYPAKGYSSKYVDDYDIEASEVIDDGIVFTCATTPTENIPIIISVTKQQEIPTATGYYTETETDELLAEKQNITDDSLETTAKTVVGAINEINKNTVKKTGESSQTVEGDIIVTGNITVSGTTYTNDTETLLVNDNMIVTNGQGATLNDLSGVAIRTDSTNAYGIVYDPATDSVKLGLGSLTGTDDDREFEFNSGEGAPIAIRDEDSDLTDGNVLEWDSSAKKLVDSGLATDDIATKEELETATTKFENSLSEAQTKVDTEIQAIKGRIDDIESSGSAGSGDSSGVDYTFNDDSFSVSDDNEVSLKPATETTYGGVKIYLDEDGALHIDTEEV